MATDVLSMQEALHGHRCSGYAKVLSGMVLALYKHE